MQTKLQVITFCALFWLSHYVYAQQESGSITGQVSDPSGAVVSGTQVTLRNQSTGTAFSATTDTSGFYRAPQLAPGVYAIPRVRPDSALLCARVSKYALLTGFESTWRCRWALSAKPYR